MAAWVCNFCATTHKEGEWLDHSGCKGCETCCTCDRARCDQCGALAEKKISSWPDGGTRVLCPNCRAEYEKFFPAA